MVRSFLVSDGSASDTFDFGFGLLPVRRDSRRVGAVRPTKDETAIRQSCSKRSRLLANQFQHVPTPLEARPPDRVFPGGIAL